MDRRDRSVGHPSARQRRNANCPGRRSRSQDPRVRARSAREYHVAVGPRSRRRCSRERLLGQPATASTSPSAPTRRAGSALRASQGGAAGPRRPRRSRRCSHRRRRLPPPRRCATALRRALRCAVEDVVELAPGARPAAQGRARRRQPARANPAVPAAGASPAGRMIIADANRPSARRRRDRRARCRLPAHQQRRDPGHARGRRRGAVDGEGLRRGPQVRGSRSRGTVTERLADVGAHATPSGPPVRTSGRSRPSSCGRSRGHACEPNVGRSW